MRLRVIVFALVATAVAVGLVVPSAGAKPKPVKPGQSFSVACPSGYTALGGTVEWYDKKNQLIGTSPGTVVGTSTVRFGPAPKGTATAVVTELNCQPPDLNTYLTGTAVLYGINDSEGRYLAIIYGIPGLPLYPGSDPAFVPDCPAGTTVGFSESTFTYPAGVTVTDFGGGTFVAENTTDNTVTVTYKIACVPV